MLTEKKAWDHTKELLENVQAQFGPYWTEQFKRDPKQLGFALSRYKFAAKMACKNSRVLDLGCSEGIGAPILGEFALSYLGVDSQLASIKTAQNNLTDPKFKFMHDEFVGKVYGEFDAIICLDMTDSVMKTVLDNLSEKGICVLGAASKTADLQLHRYFHQVFSFGMNDEIIHTDLKAAYRLQVACHRRSHP